MTSVDVDESLREQSKMLLRKLKEKQSRLQNVVHSTRQDDSTALQPRGDNSGVGMKTLKERPDSWQGNVREISGTRVKECVDTSLKKSVPVKSSREGRSRYIYFRATVS